MQKRIYNKLHNYPHVYSHMYVMSNHNSNTYTSIQPAVSAYIHTRLYISVSNCIFQNICIQLYIYIYIYMYQQTPTQIQMYPNLSNHRKCIQLHPNSRKHTQANQNKSKYEEILPGTELFPYTDRNTQIHQHMPGQRYAPKHPNPIFEHTPTPDKCTRGRRNHQTY